MSKKDSGLRKLDFEAKVWYCLQAYTTALTKTKDISWVVQEKSMQNNISGSIETTN